MAVDYRKIKDVLEKSGVVLAYVFGSYAKEKAGPLSDFDIAIVFSKGISNAQYKDKELDIAEKLGKILKISKVDVINLEIATSPLLKHRAVFYGTPIFAKDKKMQFELEARVRQEYEDTKYLRKKMHAIMGRQIQEGSLGTTPLSPSQEKSFTAYVHR
ncbi:MAG: putative nucleotidyltransferase [Parcubacteria group bacterium Greene0714_21]|nr:MAG: putative nucleotidyltransferase [Parcubacteria group bacterium Greene0416_39]TSD03901.1 MAG: putative nucleotidyltransferase [Parcubacteria group bacterium Greene0714_21]